MASITLQAAGLDPLAVLESIYEQAELHFYVERRQDGFAIAGAEAVASLVCEGSERFERSKEFIEQTLENAIVIGDESLPFFGPHFFCSYSFSEQPGESARFPSATVFVPRWQVSLMGDRSIAVANALLDSESDVEQIAERIWNANTKFATFASGSSVALEDRKELRIVGTVEDGGADRFVQSVATAVSEIERGDYEKIVLARALDLEASEAFHPLEVLNGLRERFPDCYSFSVANGQGQSFIGSSPERLARARDGILLTEALAGTVRRGSTASEDAALGASLRSSAKDRHEQSLVLDSILRRLEHLGISGVEYDPEPSLKKLQNVQHLLTEIRADLTDGVNLLDVVSELHPTPAVGGTPRETACPRIRELEGFDRELYAGAIGWVDCHGDGEFLVGIRSAMIDGDRARLYAGGGIVGASNPERELSETELKFRVLKENLL
ncbi:MAG: isochorismate synthase [Symploca sp. SIO2D2]|nr:isochorismate synthase [Symploca sp. SIO2D2]